MTLVPDPAYDVPGLFLGAPDGRTPPSPLLTHWVSWDGGFNAWCRPLADGYLLLVSNEDGDPFEMVDGDGHPVVNNWTLGVLRHDAECTHESEASPVNVLTAVEQLSLVNWKERDEE